MKNKTNQIFKILFAFFICHAVQAGEYRHEQKNYIASLPAEQIAILAKQGDIDAQFWLAKYFYSATGGVNSYCVWITKAIEQGHAEAATEFYGEYYGEQTCKNKEVKGPSQSKEYWLNKAARAGFAEAQYMLYLEHKLSSKNSTAEKMLADKWLKSAANLNHSEALTELAARYLYGVGDTKQNISKGIELYERAIRFDNDPISKQLSTDLLGDLFLNKLQNVANENHINPEKALLNYQLCAEAGAIYCYPKVIELYRDPKRDFFSPSDAFVWAKEMLIMSESLNNYKFEYQIMGNRILGDILADERSELFDPDYAVTFFENVILIASNPSFENKAFARSAANYANARISSIKKN